MRRRRRSKRRRSKKTVASSSSPRTRTFKSTRTRLKEIHIFNSYQHGERGDRFIDGFLFHSIRRRALIISAVRHHHLLLLLFFETLSLALSLKVSRPSSLLLLLLLCVSSLKNFLCLFSSFFSLSSFCFFCSLSSQRTSAFSLSLCFLLSHSHTGRRAPKREKNLELFFSHHTQHTEDRGGGVPFVRHIFSKFTSALLLLLLFFCCER